MILLAALAMAASQPALAKKGDCAWLHGEFVFANGSGIRRIWEVGPRHVLRSGHILNLDDDDDDVPDRRFRFENAWPEENYYGDFYVCARERFIPGHMQPVRLKAVKKLVVDRYKNS